MSKQGAMRRRTIALLAVASFAVGASAAALVSDDEPAETAPPTLPPFVTDLTPEGAPPLLPQTLRIAAVGDITLGRTPSLPDGGPASVFRSVAPQLKGDVVLGNLETTLATGGVGKCGAGASGCFMFRAPPDYARGLRRTGFTILNLANNHAYDFGASAQAETVAALDRAGIRHTGRPGEIAVVQTGGIRIAVVGFAPYDWAQSLLDLVAARRLVRRAAARADLVVVTMHAGAEGSDRGHVRPGAETYLGEQRGDVVAFAHAVVGAGADVVIGHGPHVLRGLEWYRGRLIAYSLGNFSSYHTLSVSGTLGASAILRVTLRRDGAWVEGQVVPVRLVGAGTPTIDRRHAAWDLMRDLSRADFGPRGMRISMSGELMRPSTQAGAGTQSSVRRSQKASPAHRP
jgi:poly-gamma-glutamate capsule biosynthesis protein CapA/YwtB (metallophosphatase superfamily)